MKAADGRYQAVKEAVPPYQTRKPLIQAGIGARGDNARSYSREAPRSLFPEPVFACSLEQSIKVLYEDFLL